MAKLMNRDTNNERKDGCEKRERISDDLVYWHTDSLGQLTRGYNPGTLVKLMAQRCDICGRGAGKGNRRSHSNIATIVHRKINLQRRSMGGKRLKVCTNCLKSERVSVSAKSSRAVAKAA